MPRLPVCFARFCPFPQFSAKDRPLIPNLKVQGLDEPREISTGHISNIGGRVTGPLLATERIKNWRRLVRREWRRVNGGEAETEKRKIKNEEGREREQRESIVYRKNLWTWSPEGPHTPPPAQCCIVMSHGVGSVPRKVTGKMLFWSNSHSHGPHRREQYWDPKLSRIEAIKGIGDNHMQIRPEVQM